MSATERIDKICKLMIDGGVAFPSCGEVRTPAKLTAPTTLLSLRAQRSHPTRAPNFKLSDVQPAVAGDGWLRFARNNGG